MRWLKRFLKAFQRSPELICGAGLTITSGRSEVSISGGIQNHPPTEQANRPRFLEDEPDPGMFSEAELTAILRQAFEVCKWENWIEEPRSRAAVARLRKMFDDATGIEIGFYC